MLCTGCRHSIARPQRNGAACADTLLCVCPADSTLALVSLTYPPPTHPPARGRQLLLSDTFLVTCDGESIVACHITSALVTHETPSAATWVSDQELLLGTASGNILTVRLRPSRNGAAMSTMSGSSGSSKMRQPVVTRVLSLQQYASRVCGLAVLGAAGSSDGSAARRCVLVATPHMLLCFPGAGSVREVLAQYDSATAVSIGLAIELDVGA